MTSSVTMPYPCSFVSIRGEIALLEKNKKVKISKQSEPNIGKLPGPPHNRKLPKQGVFAIRTQEVIENNTERSPGNPRTQRHPHPAVTFQVSQNVIPNARRHHRTPTRCHPQPHRPLSRTMAFSPQSADPQSGKWSALCLIR
jgi:hypothetical protein